MSEAKKEFTISDGQIFLHKNWKATNNQPTVRGSMMVEGVEYEISLWPSKSGKEGSFSGKVKVADNSWKTGNRAETHKGLNADGDVPNNNKMDDIDTIPF